MYFGTISKLIYSLEQAKRETGYSNMLVKEALKRMISRGRQYSIFN